MRLTDEELTIIRKELFNTLESEMTDEERGKVENLRDKIFREQDRRATKRAVSEFKTAAGIPQNQKLSKWDRLKAPGAFSKLTIDLHKRAEQMRAENAIKKLNDIVDKLSD